MTMQERLSVLQQEAKRVKLERMTLQERQAAQDRLEGIPRGMTTNQRMIWNLMQDVKAEQREEMRLGLRPRL